MGESRVGLDGCVQLTTGTECLFFEKSKHDALLKALAKRGHHLSKPDYRELDAEARLMRRSDDNWLPVTSSKHNTVLEWSELAKVLTDASIFTGRVVSIGSRTPVDVRRAYVS